MRNKARKWVFAAIKEATAAFPFPVRGIDSDNGSDFINWELLCWCEREKLTLTGPGRKTRTTPPCGTEELAHRAANPRITPL